MFSFVVKKCFFFSEKKSTNATNIIKNKVRYALFCIGESDLEQERIDTKEKSFSFNGKTTDWMGQINGWKGIKVFDSQMLSCSLLFYRFPS